MIPVGFAEGAVIAVAALVTAAPVAIILVAAVRRWARPTAIPAHVAAVLAAPLAEG
jgi:hypothetical protein